MKQLLHLLVCASLLTACGNDDTGGHSGHATHDPAGDSAQAPSTVASASMMSIMHKMDSDMAGAQLTNDPDRDFALMMKLHHQSAVEMAELEIGQGKDTAVQRLAQQMRTDQMREIQVFDRFLNTASKATPSDRFASEFKSTVKAMDHAAYTPSKTLDGEFLQMMIPHHQSGIDMAKVYLKHGTNEELKEIARNIISSQAEEIVLMQSIRKE